MLVADYYTVLAKETTAESGTFRIALNPDCKVYEGHFPGEPVCPGVCNIQMIKECLEQTVRHRCMLTDIRQCRLTTLVTPLQHPEVEINIAVSAVEDKSLTFRATVGKGDEVYLDLKAEATYYEP